jgi:hypothetical protein
MIEQKKDAPGNPHIGYALIASGLFRLCKRLTSMVGDAVKINQRLFIDTMNGKSNDRY